MTVPAMRIGQGIDVHAFSADPARPLVLGGVVIGDGTPGLVGHSDADVVAHAIGDALLGAAALGDLGRHFPERDPRWRGADSLDLLAEIVRLVAGAGWTPVNVDCTVVAERPQLAPHVTLMGERLTAVLGATAHVKATRAEGLGALGRAEGIGCLAVALVEAPAGGGRDDR